MEKERPDYAYIGATNKWKKQTMDLIYSTDSVSRYIAKIGNGEYGVDKICVMQ